MSAMKRHYFVITAALLLFVACQKEHDPVSPEPGISPVTITLSAEETERMALLETDYQVPENEILQRAGNLIQTLRLQQTLTKSYGVYGLPAITDSIVGTPADISVKGLDTDNATLKIYVVSLGKNGGYALYGGDKRARNLLAYSESGNYDPDNRLLNDLLLNYMSSEIERKESMRGDTIYKRLLARYGTVGERAATKTLVSVWNGYEYILIEVDNVTSEYIGTETETTYAKWALMKSLWSELSPYNKLIRGNKGYIVPSAITAVAQIMNYYKHGSFEGHAYMWDRYVNSDWTNVSQEAQNDVAQLYYDLGKAGNFSVQYKNVGYAVVRKERIPLTLPNFGYQACTVKPYNTQTISEALSKNTPVYIQGHSKGNDGTSTWAWVIDGENTLAEWMVYSKTYYNQGQVVWMEQTKESPTYYHFVHCNWGTGKSEWTERGLYRLHSTLPYMNTDLYIIPDIKPAQ